MSIKVAFKQKMEAEVARAQTDLAGFRGCGWRSTEKVAWRKNS